MNIFILILLLIFIWCLVELTIIIPVHLKRNNEVCEFRISLIDKDLSSYEKLPSYDIMEDYCWIPLTEENWVGKDYPQLSFWKIHWLTFKYFVWKK